MPSIPTDDLAPVVHGVWTLSDEGTRSACGVFFERGQHQYRVTTQDADVTCPACIQTLRAAGLAAGVAQK